MGKIFVSYNHNDQDIVDTIARKLAIEFGKDNIFYDKWSIQPGESIIAEMNDGLTSFDTFFLFASENSLSSSMVGLEWQNALMKAVKENLKFVVVKISDCQLPTILTVKLYIDLYSNGLDEAIRQMKDVAKSNSNYQPLPDFDNLQATTIVISNKEIKVTVEAKKYSEQNAVICFACKNPIEEFGLVLTGQWTCGQNIITYHNGEKYNSRWACRMDQQLRPGFPYEFVVRHENELNNVKIFVLCNEQKGDCKEISII